MSWCELENGFVCKGGARAEREMHPTVSKQYKYPSVSIQVILAKPTAEVSQKNKGEAYRKWLCKTHLNLLSFDFSFEISTFSLLFY